MSCFDCKLMHHVCMLTHSPLVKYWGCAAGYSRKSTSRWVLFRFSAQNTEKYQEEKNIIGFYLLYFSTKRATKGWIYRAPQSCQTWSGGGRYDSRQGSGGNSCWWQRSVSCVFIKIKLFSIFFSRSLTPPLHSLILYDYVCLLDPMFISVSFRKGEGSNKVEATQHSWAVCGAAALLQGNHRSVCWLLWS